ncbi:hypothetical protein RBB78_06555 [Tunturiibacter empetritectus]|uniref:hypothetical protein n=1 Tax=Tunturiibacter empetritectus TaxID=3069691 RepID=UPI003D9B02FB
MIRKYGVNQFKFDGTGNANTVFRGSRFDSDFDAMIHLIGEPASGEAGYLHQSHHGNRRLTLLAVVCGFNMARR